ncbi:MAG: hypothetical protein WCX31_13815 [Salinivirgaceae bacterium]|jgi:tetratricopeptide (TPR) repeat protein
MNKEDFYSYLTHPELLDDRSLPFLEKILEEYPYFQSVRLLYIKNLNNQGSIRYDRELRKTAVWITDRSKLFYLLDKRVLLPVNESVPSFHRTALATENQDSDIDFSALSLITDFTVDQTTHEFENDELDQLIMTGSAQSTTFFDVGDQINLEEFKKSFQKKKVSEAQSPIIETPANRRSKLIDTFIVEQPRIIPRNQKEANSKTEEYLPKGENPELITDTLAQIYIKQGFYEKAIFAYEKLSLKYPEKNSYFADQIRKIKQIINNQ